ncbi:hypothetical protein BDW02DRAFT_488318 [Decorospora gaudefroyi]|uniref:C2H2-type domain-containing protein n=1 Tax=Decorospora gaudefroyi TaxID=184978 RepID=A0A6A5KRP5_9PLEO|nr:hypothetical protein BDW02DRAFT_488318 [Decorospora gaudefroyi]
MLDTAQYYADDDDAVPRSPGLTAIIVKTTPSPPPRPFVTAVSRPQPSIQSVSSPLLRRQRKESNRRKTQPTQGDWVLFMQMEPNRPDIAQQVSEHALNSGSDSGSDSGDDDMAEPHPLDTTNVPATFDSAPVESSDTQSVGQQHAAQEPPRSTPDPKATMTHRDSVLEDDVIKPAGLVADRRSSQASSVHVVLNGTRPNINGTHLAPSGGSTLSASSLQPPSQQPVTLPNGHSHEISSATSVGLRQLTIPQSRGPPTDTLPALQAPSPANDASVGSPGQQLPSFRHMDDIARSATSDHEASRTNTFPHRHSISSVGQSPTSIVRQLSISSHSPATPFPPLSASSPMAASDLPPRGDLFLMTGGGGVLFGADARRSSQAASDNGPYPVTLHSASSTSESYQSSDGLSPGTQQTPLEPRPRHMSLDTLVSRVLPPPLNSGLPHIPSQAPGSFKCDYPNCTAAPFQTQYLLNSHTNVHSSNRPHYCPVKGCPRGEGGKGFKRKNEMIRHGLVHQSPGYVCPFCPDREHKYPRPDNLQRHVRVHHPDKDKDDAQLRDVLAQRPEGGSRGRRRRVSESGH